MELINVQQQAEQSKILEKVENDELNDGIIYFVEDVEDGTFKDVLLKLKYLERKRVEKITIKIHSYGGSLDCLFALADEFERLKKKDIIIETQVLGVAFSVGAGLAVLGSKGHRFCSKNSSYMFHPASYGLDNDYSGNQALVTKFFDKCNNNMANIIADAIHFKSEKDRKSFIGKMDKGIWLFADEALKMGVVDGII